MTASQDKRSRPPVKCHQCQTPAMYLIGDAENIPLCLDCYLKFTQISQQALENCERMVNFYADEMAATIGVPPIGPRFPPRPRPTIVAGVKLNNISVSNSVVGAVNTGSIGTVDQSIGALQQSGESELAEAITLLSEAILVSQDISPNQRNELVDILSIVAKEAASPKDMRKNAVAHSLLERAMKLTATANDITDICQKWWPVVVAAFGLSL